MDFQRRDFQKFNVTTCGINDDMSEALSQRERTMYVLLYST